MKVKAYRCNICLNVYEDEAMQGIIPIEDMFDKMKSFPITYKPDTTDVHACNECYDTIVLMPSRQIADLKEREKKIQELGLLWRSNAVHRHRNKTFKK